MGYLNFYSANQFPIAQGHSGGPYTLFSSGPGIGTAPIGPHRQAPEFPECPMAASHHAVAHRSAHTLHPHRRYGQKPLMAFYRPNQPMQRGIYANRTSLTGMGDGIDLTDPTTLLVLGGGVLLVAAMLGGHKVGKKIGAARKRGRRRKAARLRTQADLLEL
jgi:hypothetical protein